MSRDHRCAPLWLAAIALALTAPALAAPAPTLKMRAAQLFGDDHAWHKCFQRFGEILKARTGGELEVQIFSRGVLGEEKDYVPHLLMGRLDLRFRRPLGLLLGSALVPLATPLAQAGDIPVQTLDLASARPARRGAVLVRELLPGEVEEVTTHLVSLIGPARHDEPAGTGHEVVWLFLEGRGTLRTRDRTYEVDGETVARAPLGWPWRIDVPRGEVLHGLRVRKRLTAEDRAELGKFPENNAAPHVKRFRECPAYGEDIKSARTVSRTILPENYVPRVAMGTVETLGPDRVAPHRHPMLEQLFLGLKDNDITVVADDARAPLTPYSLLHIPLGSSHGAEVTTGKKLHYVWMDFFTTKEGQDWLKTHKPVEQDPGKPKP